MTDNPMNGTGAAPVLDFPMNMTGTMPETNDMDTAATLGVPVNDDGTINLADLDIDGFGAQMQQQTVRMDSLETLHSVWLYDDEADAKKRVDEDGRYSVYGVPSMRNNDADLYVYGQDYVRAAAPALADAPLTFCERYIETIDDPATKSEYRKALDTLMASGKDTKQDYYGLIGRFVRDDVRRNYQKQQERKKHAEKLRQEGIALIDDMLMGREQFDIDRINENEEMARLLATEDGKSRLKSMRRAAYAMQSVVMCAAANRYTDFTPSNALSAIDTASDWIADENGELDPVAAKLFASSIYKWAQELQETGRERGFDDRFRDSLGQIIGNIMEAGSYERNIESEYKKAEALKDYYHVFEIPEIQERQLKTNRKRYEIAKAKYEAIRPKLERRKLVQGYINQAVDQGRVLDDNAAWWEKVSAFTAASAPATMIYAAGGWTSLPLTLAASGVGSVVNYTNQNEMYASEGVAEFFTNQERLPDENEKIGIYARAAQDAGIDTLVEVLPGQAVGFPATRLIGWMSKGGGKVGGMARYAARLGEKKWGAVGINLVASFGEEAVFEPLAAGILKGTSDRFLEAAGVPNYQSRGWGIVTEELKETWKDPAQLGSILATVVLLGGGHLPETIKASKSLEQQSAEWALAGLSEEAVAQARLSSTPEETAARLYQAEMNSDPEAVARRIREQREKRGEQTDENLKRTGLRSKGDEAAALRATWKQLEERGLMPHVEAVPSVDGKEQYRLTERDAEGKEKVMLMDAAETDAYLTIRAQRVMELSIGTVQANVFGMQDEMLRGLYGEAAAAAIRRNADKTGVAIRDVSEVEGVTEDMVQEARNDREMSRMWLATAADRIGGVWKNISAAFTQRLALEGIDEGGTRAFRMQTQRESQMDGRKVFGSLVTYVNGGASVADLMEEALESHTDMTLQVRAAEIAEANKELTAQQAREHALQEMADKVKPVIQAMAKMDYGANRAIKAMADERNWQGDNLRGTVIEAISHIQKSRLLANGDVLPAAWREGVAQAADALGFMDDIRRWGELYKQLKDSGTDVAGIEEYFAKQNAYARTVFEQARVDEQVIASWERAQQFQERKAAGEKGSGAVSATRAVEQAEKDEEEIRQREKAEAALPKLDEEEEAAQKEAYKVSAEQAVRQTVELAAPNAPSALDGVFAGNVCTHNEEGGYYSGLVNVARLRDSKDVEQVKQGNKGKHGVINPLVGDYQKDAPPIFVWQRKNGALEVISGRHRYALALATGTTAIPAYVYAEDETHNLKWARLLDFENNMRDDQADELTAAIYVRETGFDDLTLTRKGLMRNGTKSRRGILIGREAREELWTRFRNRAVSPMDAEVIVNMTKNIKDTGRIEEIQRRCCMLLDERKSWEYIGAMVQLMANKESVFMKQGLLDLGADFEEDLARAAKYIETCTKQLNEAISVMKSGRKMSGKQADLARRLGQLTTSSEDSQQRLDALTTMKAMFDNIGMYPDLVAGAQMWDGKTEIDAVGMALERGMREAQANEAEDGMSVEEQLEQAEAEANRKAAEELTGSLFGGSFSVNLDDYFQPLQEGEADIPIEKLYTLKKEPRKSIDNAMRFMRMAARGEMDKRAAVSVVEHGDGTYTIADGNATSRALSEMGAKAVRVKVVGEDTGSRLYNSAYLVKDEMPGADADGKLRTHGLEALQGDAAVQRAFGQAEENLPILEKLVDAAAAKVGGEKMMRPANSENGLATKKPSTAIDKARRDYNGDISRVVDLIGGTVVMPSDGDFGDAVKAIRKSLPEGASIAKVKKLGFQDNAPRYKDVKVSVRFANGGIGEIILVEGRINDAKFNRGGHNIYDVSRELEPYADSMPEVKEALKKLYKLSSMVYAAGMEPAALDRAKSSAASALEALQPLSKKLSISSSVKGMIKSPDLLSKRIKPDSVLSTATPRVSLIQNISESAIPQVDGKGKHIPQDGASFSLTPEMESIKSRAVADGTFMKAPNGQPTNLTEHQWLQVRTKAFKDWFGDWVKVSAFMGAYNRIMGMEPVTGLTGREFQKDGVPLTKKVPDYWKEKYNGVVESPELGKVILDLEGVKSSIGHGVGALKSAAFSAVGDVIEHGIVFDRQKNWKDRGYDTAVLAAPVTINGAEYICEVVVTQRPNKQGFYLHEVELKEKLGDVFKTPTEGSTPRAYRSILALRAAEVKELQKNCSKIVDENGEPKVVYHQTAGGFTVFNTKYQLAGRYDSETPEGFFLKPTAEDIGLKGKEQMSLYMKAGNVLEFANRDEAVRYWKKNVEGYAGLSDKLESMDADYEKRTNEAEKEADDWYYNHSDEDVTSEEIEQSCAKLDRLIDEWKRETNEVRLRLKGLINDYIRQSGYDAMHITRDAGSFGRSVETYIAFAPTQIKSATENRGTFDAGNADITFSVAEQRKMDARYMEAVERGDMEEAGRMVREYAAKKGYIPQDREYWMNHRPMAEGTEKKTPEQRVEDGEALSLLDLAHGYWNVPKDFFEHPEWYDTQPGSREAAYKVRDLIERAKKWLAGEIKTEPCIKCYRAVPKDVKEDKPRNGDWVTPSSEYAEEHIRHSLDGKGRVQVFSAKVGELYFNGDSVMEFGYHDGNDYAYRNTKNNRKLLAPVTYEDVEVRAEDGEFEGVDLGEWNTETKRFDRVPYRYNMERRVVPLSKRFNPREAGVSFSVSPTLHEDLTAAYEHRLKATAIIPLCTAPRAFAALGLPMLDIVTTPRIIGKVKNKHHMDLDEVERAVQGMNDPLLIIQENAGRLILYPGGMTWSKGGAGDIVAPVRLEVSEDKAHFMTTMYGLDNLQKTEEHLKMGHLLYSKYSKAELAASNAPGLSPDLVRLVTESGFTDNTITAADIVKQESADFPGSFSVTSYAERQRAVREKMNEMALRDAQTNELIQELAKEGQDLRLGGKKGQQEAMAALARVEALVNRTRAMLPPKLAKLGRLDKTLAWVRVYSDMVQSGEVKLNEKITSTAITQKFIDKMNKSRDEALLHGLSEEEAQDVLRNIGAERLSETLARVTDFCTARLTALLKERSLDAIMAMARRITWQMQDNTMQDLEQMEAELRDSLLAAGENVDLRQAERVLKRIERKRLDLLKRMVEEAYKNAFPKKQPGQRSPRGKMDAESYRMLMRMHEAMSMTAEQVNDRQTEIEALLGKLEETAPDYEEKRVQLEDELMLLGAFGNWEGMDVGKAADAAKQFLEFVQTSRTAWQAKLEDEKQYYAYLRELMSQNFTVEDTPNTRSAGKQAQDVKGSTRQTVEHVAVNLMNYGQLMRSAAPKLGQQFTMERRNEIANANAGLANDNRAFETAFYHFVAEACGSAKEADCIKWLNKFAEVTTKSGVIVQELEEPAKSLVMQTDDARMWVSMSKEEREQKREEIAKADAVRMRKTLDIPTEEDIPALQAALLSMDSRMRVLKNGTEVPSPSMASKVKIRRQKRKPPCELKMSRDQALNLILILEQEDYRHLISSWGFIPVDSMGNEVPNSEDNLEAIDVRKSLASLYKFVGEDGLKLGYRMREYVGENGKRLAKCFEEYNGVPLNMREKYWKGNFNISPLKEKDQLTDAGSMAGSGYSFMIDRVLHYSRSELTNSATLIFGQTMQEQLNYIHTAHITRLWRRLLQDAEFANLMRANMGEDWMRGIKTWINVIDKANGAGELNMWRMTKWQSALMRGAAVAALSGNIQTIVKQSSAVIHAVLGGEVPYKVVSKGGGAVEFAWRGLGIGKWMSSMGHVVVGRGKVSAAAVLASEWYQARIDSDKKHIASRMGLAAGEVQHAYTGRIAEKGMEVMETVDRWSNLVSCCALADAVYRQMETLNTQNKLGLTAEQMEREALQAVGRMLNEVAQPKMATQKTLATAAKPYGVSLGGFLTMFRSEMLNKLGMLCARAMEGEFAAGLGNYLAFGAFNAAVSMLLAYIRFGGGKDDKDEWWRTLAAFGYESMFADMYAIPIVGDALKYGESKLTGKYFHDAGVFGVFGIDRASKGLESLYEAAEGEKDLTAQQYAKHTQNVLRTTSLVMQAGRAFGLQNTWFGTVMEGVLDAATTANVVRTVTDVAERVKK